MGDTTDGSSTAAQRAPHEQTPPKSGFFNRIIGALSPSDAGEVIPEDPAQPVATDTMLPAPGMVNLRRMRVEDVMVPKSEITSVPVDIAKNELVALFRESGLSRLPVFDGTLDTPTGLIHLKDLALTHGFNGGTAAYDLKELLRPLLYAPPSMPIGVLLQKMQTERIHMALVIDEYGGVDGLVTIEDLIEQVIGEIEDEHDTEETALWIKDQDGSYLAEAKAPLDEFESEVGVRFHGEDDDDEEIETLGGLVFVLSGHVPTRGEVIVHPNGTEFEVVDADPRRIKRLRVHIRDTDAS